MAKEIFTGSNGIVSKVPVHLLIKSTWFPTWTWIEFVGFYSQGIWTYMEGVSIMPKKICSWYAAQQWTNTKWSYFANIEEISYLLREDFFFANGNASNVQIFGYKREDLLLKQSSSTIPKTESPKQQLSQHRASFLRFTFTILVWGIESKIFVHLLFKRDLHFTHFSQWVYWEFVSKISVILVRFLS